MPELALPHALIRTPHTRAAALSASRLQADDAAPWIAAAAREHCPRGGRRAAGQPLASTVLCICDISTRSCSCRIATLPRSCSSRFSCCSAFLMAVRSAFLAATSSAFLGSFLVGESLPMVGDITSVACSGRADGCGTAGQSGAGHGSTAAVAGRQARHRQQEAPPRCLWAAPQLSRRACEGPGQAAGVVGG